MSFYEPIQRGGDITSTPLSNSKTFSKKKLAPYVVLAAIFAFLSISSYSSSYKGGRKLTEGEQLVIEIDEILAREPPLGFMGARPVSMLLGIYTTNSDEELEKRLRIRDTYLNAKNNSTSFYCPLSEFTKQPLQPGNDRSCRIPYAFIMGSGDETRPTEHFDDTPMEVARTLLEKPVPDENFDDFIHLNIQENIDEGKSATYLKFAANVAAEYHIDYIAKADTDTLINMNVLLDFMDTDLPPKPMNRRMYGGHTWGNFHTSSYYAVGSFYFMSIDMAFYAGITLSHSARDSLTGYKGGEPKEDADVGTFLHSHPRPLKFIMLSQYLFWYHPLKSNDEWYDYWENKMDELPKKASVMPFKEICHEFELDQKEK